MEHNNGIVLVYTGGEIVIQRLKAELELQGINSIVKDEFKQGIAAGFGAGIPSAIDLYVAQTDEKRARQIIDEILD